VAYISPFARYESSVPRGRRESGSRVAGSRNSRVTLDIYTQAVSAQKRQACNKLVEMLLGSEGVYEDQHPSAPLNSQRVPLEEFTALFS
jgi:hypothetical protein